MRSSNPSQGAARCQLLLNMRKMMIKPLQVAAKVLGSQQGLWRSFCRRKVPHFKRDISGQQRGAQIFHRVRRAAKTLSKLLRKILEILNVVAKISGSRRWRWRSVSAKNYLSFSRHFLNQKYGLKTVILGALMRITLHFLIV